MKNTLLKIRNKIRLFFGVCPKCNSDAPEKDDCSVCNNFYGTPSKELKKEWETKNNIQYTCPKTKKLCNDGMCGSANNCNIGSDIQDSNEINFEEIVNQCHKIAKDFKHLFDGEEMKNVNLKTKFSH